MAPPREVGRPRCAAGRGRGSADRKTGRGSLMLPIRIQGATHEFGRPADWDEAKHGKCSTLAVKALKDGAGTPLLVSAWQPTPLDLELLKAGAPVLLYVWGGGHPPVALHVGEAP